MKCIQHQEEREAHPKALLYRLLDLAGINSQIIYAANNCFKRLILRVFLSELELSLVTHQIQKKAVNQHLSKLLHEKPANISESKKDAN